MQEQYQQQEQKGKKCLIKYCLGLQPLSEFENKYGRELKTCKMCRNKREIKDNLKKAAVYQPQK